MALKSLEELEKEVAIARVKNKEKERLLKIALESKKDFKEIQRKRVALDKEIKRLNSPRTQAAKKTLLFGGKTTKKVLFSGGKTTGKFLGRNLLRAGKIGLKGLENFSDNLDAMEKAEKARRKQSEEIKTKAIQKRKSIRKKAKKKASIKKSPRRRSRKGGRR